MIHYREGALSQPHINQEDDKLLQLETQVYDSSSPYLFRVDLHAYSTGKIGFQFELWNKDKGEYAWKGSLQDLADKITREYQPLPEIPDQRIKDLLCCAFEGGSNYWYDIKDYMIPAGISLDALEYPQLDLPLLQDGAVIITDLEARDGSEPSFHDVKLNRTSLLNGLILMYHNHPKHFADFMAENEDAITGDVFLQLACFGDVIFS